MPKIKLQTLKNTNFFWARHVPTFPVYHHLGGSLPLDGPSTDKFLKEALAKSVPLKKEMEKAARQFWTDKLTRHRIPFFGDAI
jgi:hypothetical protein